MDPDQPPTTMNQVTNPHQVFTVPFFNPPQQSIQLPYVPAASCYYYANNPAPPHTPNLQPHPQMNPLCCCQRFQHGHPCFSYYFGAGIPPPATNFSGTPCQVNPLSHLGAPPNGHSMGSPMPSQPGGEHIRYFDFEYLEVGSFSYSLDPSKQDHIVPRVRLNLSKMRVSYEFTSSFYSFFKLEDHSFKSEPTEPIDFEGQQHAKEQRQNEQQQQQQQQHPQPQQQPQPQALQEQPQGSQQLQQPVAPTPPPLLQQQLPQPQQNQPQQQEQHQQSRSPQLQVRNFCIMVPFSAISSVFLDSPDVYLVISKAPLLLSSERKSSNIVYEVTTLDDPSYGQIRCNRLHRITFRGNHAESFYTSLLEAEPRLRTFANTRKMIGHKDHYFDANGLPEPETA